MAIFQRRKIRMFLTKNKLYEIITHTDTRRYKNPKRRIRVSRKIGMQMIGRIKIFLLGPHIDSSQWFLRLASEKSYTSSRRIAEKERLESHKYRRILSHSQYPISRTMKIIYILF